MHIDILIFAIIAILIAATAMLCGAFVARHRTEARLLDTCRNRVAEAQAEGKALVAEAQAASRQQIADAQESFRQQVADMQHAHEQQMNDIHALKSKQDEALKEAHDQQLGDLRQSHAQQLAAMQESHVKQIDELRTSYERQLAELRSAHDQQFTQLKAASQEQMQQQLQLISEQMQTTSERVLKARQAELGEANIQQVSKIVDPLQQSLRMMREALDDSKTKHQEAIHKLDATIEANMKHSAHLGETAARLTRALTAEVKLQGNFGELKLRQLLEDLGLKDGEQFTSQAHLRDKHGKLIKDEDGRYLIPDFILHFPNNRDVIVDSKMSFTAYERYINATDPDEQTRYLHEHIASVRAQVERLARKDYSRYLQAGYNKLNFVIMYIHTEGALNLALLNDHTLWREAYDKGVLVLGPQTMYMNLRILELMWTQVRQLQNQEEMMKAANLIVERTQDFAARFSEVESRVRETQKSIDSLKITTGNGGPSIITAARNLIKAGARESKKKKSLGEALPTFIDSDTTLLTDGVAPDAEQKADE